MVEDAELRREASGLLLPVEDERPRHHDQRRRGSAAFPGGGPQLAARLQQGEHLDGLAQAHVVGQAAAEAELPEEVEPAEAVALIAAELALEPGRRVRGRDALELAQPLARLLEPLVESRLGLLGQQDVEQADLRPPEPEVIPLRRAHPGQGHVLLQPLLRQQAEAAVAQRHEVLAAPQGREQGGERHLLIAEGRPAVQLEPVDPGRHLDPEVARLAVQLPLGLDAPALLEEGPRGFRQVACEQLQGLALAVVGPAVEADLLEPGREGPLGRRVAQQQPSLVGLEDAPGRAPRGHDVAVVLEGEVADEPVLIPAGHPAPVVAALDRQVRPRRRRDLFVPQVLRQVEPGQVRQPEQFREEFLLLLGGDGHFTLLSQQRDPLEGVEVKERCDAILPEHEPAAQQQQGSLQRQSLLGATELAGDRVRLAGIVRRHLQPELPGAGVIPAERPHRAVRLRFPQQAPARGAEHRQQGLAERVREEEASRGAIVVATAGVVAAHLLAPAGQDGHRLAIGGFRQVSDLTQGEASALGFAPLAVPLAIACRHLEHEPIARQGGRDIHDIDDLVSGR